MKKSMIAAAVFPVFAIAMAGQLQPYSPYPMEIYTPQYDFDIYFSGLAMQPYANQFESPSNLHSRDLKDIHLNHPSSGYHFGFDLGAVAIFSRAQANIRGNWERYHTAIDLNSFAIDPSVHPEYPYKLGKEGTNYHFDEINLEYGSFFQFGSQFAANFFGGVSLSRLVQLRSILLSNQSESVAEKMDIPSKFWGLGPQIGIDFLYKVLEGFQFVGNSRVILFTGMFSNETIRTTKLSAPTIHTISIEDKVGIVPGFEGKLGFAYEFPIRYTSMIKIEAGYRAQIYLSAIRSIDFSKTTSSMSDFGLAGPYGSIEFAF